MKAAFRKSAALFALASSTIGAVVAQNNDSKPVSGNKIPPMTSSDSSCVQRVILADYVEGTDTFVHYRDYNFCENSVVETSARYGNNEAISGMSYMSMNDILIKDDETSAEMKNAQKAYKLRMK